MPISVPATPPCSAHRLLSRGRSSNLRPFALPRPDALRPLPYRPYAVWHLVYADTSITAGTRRCAPRRRRSWPIGVWLCGFSERALAAFFHELTVAAEVSEERQVPIP